MFNFCQNIQWIENVHSYCVHSDFAEVLKIFILNIFCCFHHIFKCFAALIYNFGMKIEQSSSKKSHFLKRLLHKQGNERNNYLYLSVNTIHIHHDPHLSMPPLNTTHNCQCLLSCLSWGTLIILKIYFFKVPNINISRDRNLTQVFLLGTFRTCTKTVHTGPIWSGFGCGEFRVLARCRSRWNDWAQAASFWRTLYISFDKSGWQRLGPDHRVLKKWIFEIKHTPQNGYFHRYLIGDRIIASRSRQPKFYLLRHHAAAAI